MGRRLKSLFLFFIILEVLLILYLLVHNFSNDTYSCDYDIKTKVLLIGIDAADWYYINPLLKEEKLPNLASLMKAGSYGYLNTIATSNLTSGAPMQWTSMITGKSYLEHGIVDYYKFFPDENEYVGPLQSGMRRTKALWNILSENNITVGVSGWWATWPAEEVNGYLSSSYVKYRLREPNSSLTRENKLQLTYTGTIYDGSNLNQTYPSSFFYQIAPIIREKERICGL